VFRHTYPKSFLGAHHCEKRPHPGNKCAHDIFTLAPDQTPPLHLEEFKAQCQELGFNVGTSDFGNCVLQLNAAKQ
jgi:hypothetical protein